MDTNDPTRAARIRADADHEIGAWNTYAAADRAAHPHTCRQAQRLPDVGVRVQVTFQGTVLATYPQEGGLVVVAHDATLLIPASAVSLLTAEVRVVAQAQKGGRAA